MGNFIPHPTTVIAINLTTIRTDTASSKKNAQLQTEDSESFLLNVAGRLLMFQRDRSGPQIKIKDKNTKERPVIALKTSF